MQKIPKQKSYIIFFIICLIFLFSDIYLFGINTIFYKFFYDCNSEPNEIAGYIYYNKSVKLVVSFISAGVLAYLCTYIYYLFKSNAIKSAVTRILTVIIAVLYVSWSLIKIIGGTLFLLAFALEDGELRNSKNPQTKVEAEKVLNIKLPKGAIDVSYYEFGQWQVYSLSVQFSINNNTTENALEEFIKILNNSGEKKYTFTKEKINKNDYLKSLLENKKTPWWDLYNIKNGYHYYDKNSTKINIWTDLDKKKIYYEYGQ